MIRKALLVATSILLSAPHIGTCNSTLPAVGPISSAPGWRIDPINKSGWKWHNGWDIAVPAGTTVNATAPGQVYLARKYKGYGYLVVLNHQNGWYTMYGHNSAIVAREGEWVRAGQKIAISGNTGRSSGPHIHYEIRYSPGFTTTEEKTFLKDPEELGGIEISSK